MEVTGLPGLTGATLTVSIAAKMQYGYTAVSTVGMACYLHERMTVAVIEGLKLISCVPFRGTVRGLNSLPLPGCLTCR